MITNLDEAIKVLDENPIDFSCDIPNNTISNWLKELAYFRKKYPNEINSYMAVSMYRFGLGLGWANNQDNSIL